MATQPRYFIDNDYNIIQSTQLNQIIQGNRARLLQMERNSIEEATSYLTQRFTTEKEFTNTGAWDPTLDYEPGDRVVIDYSAWGLTISYSVGDCVIYNSQGWVAITAATVGTFIPSEWALLGDQYDIYNAKFPYPQFNNNFYYSLGNRVYWKGIVYECMKATQPFDSENLIQYIRYENVPTLNVFPDDLNNNADGQYWANAYPYNVPAFLSSPAGSLPTDKTYWELRDNRCQEMVTHLVEIVVYKLHKSIAPMNIPDLRKEGYRESITWLTKIAEGKVTPNLEQRQPNQGLQRRWGGFIRRNNSY